MDDNIHYNKLIEENMDKGFQVRLVVNEFRDIEYIQLRSIFLPMKVTGKHHEKASQSLHQQKISIVC